MPEAAEVRSPLSCGNCDETWHRNMTTCRAPARPEAPAEEPTTGTAAQAQTPDPKGNDQ